MKPGRPLEIIKSLRHSTARKYTATFISIGRNEITGFFDNYFETSIRPQECLEDVVQACFMNKSTFINHYKNDAVPIFIKIESNEGMVALADIEISEKPSLKFSLAWRDTLSLLDKERLELALTSHRTKARAMPYDEMGAAEQQNSHHQSKIIEVMLASHAYAECIQKTLRLIYRVESRLGSQSNKVRHMEDVLGL